MSKVVADTYRHSGASSDAITLDSSGNVTVNGNLTVSGSQTIAGSQTVSVADGCIFTNNQTISNAYTFPATKNGLSAGPVTLSATVTIPSGATWSVV